MGPAGLASSLESGPCMDATDVPYVGSTDPFPLRKGTIYKRGGLILNSGGQVVKGPTSHTRGHFPPPSMTK